MYVQKRQNIWKKLSNLLKVQTPSCKICFDEIKDKSFHHLFNKTSICSKCLNKYHPIFKEFKFDGINVLSIYEYKDQIKEKLFRFKGCYDYELYSTFLNIYEAELRSKYMGFHIVFVPSEEKEDLKRGFNHVKEMFKFLKLPSLDLLMKVGHNKQALNKYKNRKEASKHIVLKKNINLKSKKILIVDDVITTGSTLKISIDLIKSLNPLKIEALTMSKREFDVNKGGKNIDIIK